MIDPKDKITTWSQGVFRDLRKYGHMPESWKTERRWAESRKVRPAPMENAICWCSNPEDAIWIAKRLNLAAELEIKCRLMVGMGGEEK